MKTEIKCAFCGKMFFISQSQIRDANFCSRKCKGKGQWKNKKDKMSANSHTESTRQKRSDGLKKAYAEGRKKPPVPKGSKRWYYSPGIKGQHIPEATRHKMSDAQKRVYSEGRKPTVMWNSDGKTWAEYFGEEKALEIKMSISKTNKGKLLGEKHPNWKGGRTKLRVREVKRRYKDLVFRLERLKCFERDNYTCQDCGLKLIHPIAHHIVPYRFSKDHSAANLVTLCPKNHALRDAEFQRLHLELYH